MELPQDISIPFFAYGLFKPGELAYRRIEALIAQTPVRSLARGSLLIRDGLPLLRTGLGSEVVGYVLHFRSDKSREAYEIIATLEPDNQYRWERINPIDFPDPVNVLVGRNPGKGSSPYEEPEWSGRNDPVFVNALPLIRDMALTYGQRKFNSAPPDAFDWDRLFRLQMAYLLLWSSIERYCSLRFGAEMDPMEKITLLGEDEVFKASLTQVVSRTERVFDSRSPRKHEDIDGENSRSSAKYYYLVRSNLSHRGKGAHNDGEIIRQSLNELLDIFGLMLQHDFGVDVTRKHV